MGYESSFEGPFPVLSECIHFEGQTIRKGGRPSWRQSGVDPSESDTKATAMAMKPFRLTARRAYESRN